MPLLLRCDELKPGMRLFNAVIRDGVTLLTGGKVLTEGEVCALQDKHPGIWVRVGDPILDDVIGFEDDTRDREVAAMVQTRIAKAMSNVSERFSSRTRISALDIQAIRDSVSQVMQYLQDNPVSFALLSENLGSESYLTEHAGNVFYLSMMLGCAVRDYVDSERRRRTSYRRADLITVGMDLLPLGLGAMLADLGMYPIQDLLTKEEPLVEEDWKAIAEHPEVGAKMLPSDFSAPARAVIRTHHETFDGSGYPGRIRGDRIHVFSRIVRIADAYDAATASHVYKEAKTPARALWEMSVGPYSRCYDPLLMRIFSGLIQPFPIGAKLCLRDGRYAVVVRYNPHDAFSPEVVIVFDPSGERLPDYKLEGPLSLADRPDLELESFGDEDLSYLYDPTAGEEVAVNPDDDGSLLEAAFP